MYKIILLPFSLLLAAALFGQKPSISLETCQNWPTISNEKISNNGRYVLYLVKEGNSSSTLFIHQNKHDNNNYLIAKIENVQSAEFTEDSRRVVFIKSTDTLGIKQIDSGKEQYIPGVRSFKMPKQGNGQWLTYHLVDSSLVTCNLYTGKKLVRKQIANFWFDEHGAMLLLQSNSIKDSKHTLSIQNLKTGENSVFWKGGEVLQALFNPQGKKLAFTVNYNDKNSIWEYTIGKDSAKDLINLPRSTLQDEMFITGEPLRYSPDGTKLYFHVAGKLNTTIKAEPEAVKVDIWNYCDEFSQLEKKNMEWKNSRSFLSVINVENGHPVRLEYETDGTLTQITVSDNWNGPYALVSTDANIKEGYRKKSGRPDVYLININTGDRQLLKKSLLYADPHFSTGGQYIIWYDLEEKTYYTYNTKNKKTVNISSLIPTPLYNEQWDRASAPRPYKSTIWLKDDEAVLLYDRYDIWKVDPNGIVPPRNVTNGYGRKNKIILRLVSIPTGKESNTPIINQNETIILCGFSEINKMNGFFLVHLDNQKNPNSLIMSNEIFYFPDNLSVGLSTFLIKAKDADVYLLKRMSATRYPNLQVTTNFSSFTAISQLSPQISCNWLTSSLLNWETFSGTRGEGILYKPENFDSQKKYPVIIHFYERLSAGLNKFTDPEPSVGPINIPWFVSRGYLVFCPDIYYSVGNPGEGIYNYVVSGAQFIAEQPWVDKSKIAIQGHSWGGFEVNYLITKTKMFTAAVSAAGISDWISNYGSDGVSLCSGPSFIEQEQSRMGTTLWENRLSYINNSPIFGADNVTTPLLIMHNINDQNVPWIQSLEFFTALSRLNKKVWMLQYDESYHTVYGKKAIDYTSRLEDFFNYFLKNGSIPEWMKGHNEKPARKD